MSDVHLNMNDEIDSIERDAEALRDNLARNKDNRGFAWIFMDVLWLIVRLAHVVRVHESER